MKKAILFFIGCFYLVSQLCAQGKMIGRDVLRPPKDYQKQPTEEILLASAPKSQNALLLWYAYSDRDNNTTYQKPEDGAAVHKKMKFMQSFFVIDETDYYVHIASYEPDAVDRATKKLIKEVEDYGWAPKSKMLLYSHALVDSKSKFTRKALAVNSIESLKNRTEYANEDEKKLKLFNDPKLVGENTKDVRLYDFLFVYKTEGDAVLIGKSTTFLISNADLKILGWVSKNIIQLWNQRQTLEPNSDKIAVDERKAKEVKVSMFFNPEAAIEFQKNGSCSNAKDNMEFKDRYEKKYDPNWKRLPILGTRGSGANMIIQTGLVSEIYDLFGNPVISVEEQGEIEKAYNDQRERTRHINIVFVIDGAQTMKQFFPPVYEGIKNAVEVFSQEDATENKFKYGAVVYRDYNEAKCPDGAIDIEQRNLTDRPEDVVEFLSDEVIARNCNDKDESQAMYLGISKALRMLSPQKNETNVIILIGACGNHEPDQNIDMIKLQREMVETRTSILAFQVQNTGSSAYFDFLPQVSDLIQMSATEIQNSYKSSFDAEKVAKKIGWTAKSANSWALDFPGTSPIPGSAVLTEPNQVMKAEDLKQEIFDIVKSIDRYNEELLGQLDSKLKGMGKRTVINEGMLNFLSQMKVDIELLEKATDKNLQFFTEGYTSVNSVRLENPLYKYVLFVDQDELFALLSTLRDISNPELTTDDVREHISNCFKEIVKTNYGGGKEARNILENKSPAEIMELVTGLPASTTLLQGYKVDDFVNAKKVSEAKISEIYEYLGAKLDDLDKVKSDDSYMFKSNDNVFYWIPQGLLP